MDPARRRADDDAGRAVHGLRRARAGVALDDYDAALRWSVEDLEGFWGGDLGLLRRPLAHAVRAGAERAVLPGARWFEGATLNYAEHMVGLDEDTDRVAIVARSQSRDPFEVTFGELRDQVARARAGLSASASAPATASSPTCRTSPRRSSRSSRGEPRRGLGDCAPEFGARAVIDRFGIVEPNVLLAVAGYGYGAKHVDRRDEVAAIRAELGTLEHVVHVPYAGGDSDGSPGAIGWADLLAEPAALRFDPVPFDHPLCVLFSSGTTGLPKPIVHGHGGILVEGLKNLGLSWDLQPGDRLLWFSTTAWMMWNALVTSLLHRASIVMIDGNPAYPDLSMQWRLAEETRPTFMGASPALLMGCRKAGLDLTRLDLSSIRQLGAAGSPLPTEGYAWVYEQLGPDVLLNCGSGGTDVCTGIVQGSPMQPVFAGEIAGRCLGVDTAAFDPDGNEVVGALGELVIRAPMPSMPVGFWDDPGTRATTPPTTRTTPASGATATGSCSPSAAAASSPAAPTRRSTAAACGWARASSTRSSRSSTRCSTASSSTSRTTRAGRASSCSSSCSATGATLDDDLRARIGAARCAASSPPGTCPTRSRRCPRSPAR